MRFVTQIMEESPRGAKGNYARLGRHHPVGRIGIALGRRDCRIPLVGGDGQGAAAVWSRRRHTGTLDGRPGWPFQWLEIWAFVFACGACGCYGNGARNLFVRPPRWIHRFVIYAGYGTTFTGMGAAALCLQSPAVSRWLTVAFLIMVYALGSLGIFLAKALTLRKIAKSMPEYHASLADAPDGFGYW